MRILITGGAGFMGSNMVHFLLRQTGVERVVNFDKLTYAGNLENLRDVVADERYRFVRGDIADADTVNAIFRQEQPDIILNYAAETHVDRSLHDPVSFLKTAIFGTHTLLEAVRQYGCGKYVQISTDEVYGAVTQGEASETAAYRPRNPYSAAKAGADHLCRSYGETHGAPVIVTHSCNYYGPYQYPEKVIPLFITQLLEGKKVPLYGEGLQEREWIFTEDHCRAVWFIMTRGKVGQVYNIGTGHHYTNRDLTLAILWLMKRDEAHIEYVKDRPGHDWRYALDSSKLRQELGWSPTMEFMDGLQQTIDWYQRREDWWRPLKAGASEWYQKNYVQR